MRSIASALLLAAVALPAAAQDDAERGRLLYETHCLDCHYERIHRRDRARSPIRSLADLRDMVAARAALTRRRFSLDELEEITQYLNQSHYKLAK